MIQRMKVSLAQIDPKKRRYLLIGLGALAGGAAGFAYATWIGCSSGGCGITSSPGMATMWGAGIGGLLASG
jgi:hypothetical protein